MLPFPPLSAPRPLPVWNWETSRLAMGPCVQSRNKPTDLRVCPQTGKKGWWPSTRTGQRALSDMWSVPPKALGPVLYL